MNGEMIRITAPHFVAAVIPGVRAAHIIAYMRDWRRQRMIAYCERMGWTLDYVQGMDAQDYADVREILTAKDMAEAEISRNAVT